MITIAKNIKALAEMAGSLQKFIEFAEKINSLEQAENEAKERIERAQMEYQVVVKDIEKKITDTSAWVNKIVEEAKNQARTAFIDAKETKEKTQQECQKMVADAIKEREGIVAEKHAQVMELTDAGLQINEELAARRKELNEIEEKLENAQAAVKKMLGGQE